MKILGQNIRLELVVLIVIVLIFIAIQTFSGSQGGYREAFQTSKELAGSTLSYVMGQDIKSSWNYNQPGNVHRSESDMYKHLENNVGGEVPLPEGELFMFYQNKNSPDCCPSHYSSSTGCVCISPNQYKYLNTRAGNRTLPTEY